MYCVYTIAYVKYIYIYILYTLHKHFYKYIGVCIVYMYVYILYVYYMCVYMLSITHLFLYISVCVLYICTYVCTHTHSMSSVWTSSLTQPPDWQLSTALCQLYIYVSVYIHCIHACVCEYIVYILCMYVSSMQLGSQLLVLSVCHFSITIAQEGRWCCSSQGKVPEGQKCSAKCPGSHKLKAQWL